MSRGLYAGKISAPNLTSHTIMVLLSRTSFMQNQAQVRYFRNLQPESCDLTISLSGYSKRSQNLTLMPKTFDTMAHNYIFE